MLIKLVLLGKLIKKILGNRIFFDTHRRIFDYRVLCLEFLCVRKEHLRPGKFS